MFIWLYGVYIYKICAIINRICDYIMFIWLCAIINRICDYIMFIWLYDVYIYKICAIINRIFIYINMYLFCCKYWNVLSGSRFQFFFRILVFAFIFFFKILVFALSSVFRCKYWICLEHTRFQYCVPDQNHQRRPCKPLAPNLVLLSNFSIKEMM